MENRDRQRARRLQLVARRLRVEYYILNGAAIASLAGCGGALPLDSGQGRPPSAIAAHGDRSEAWMDAGAAKWDLLYVSNVNGTVSVYRYWQRKLVGVLTGFSRPKGECVDRDGDVYVTDRVAEDIVEYRHGATTPAAVLADPGFQDYACSVDPTTGNLAVANSYRADGDAGGIAIYKHARGEPKLYRIEHAPNPQTCAYDFRGDLLVASDYVHDGRQVVSLDYWPKGSETFVQLHLGVSGSQADGIYNVQWDGKDWALLDDGNVLRYRITNGGRATYEGTTYLSGNQEGDARFWIANFPSGLTKRGTQIVAAEPYNDEVYYWKYPAGGSSTGSLSKGLDEPYGVATSLAPNR